MKTAEMVIIFKKKTGEVTYGIFCQGITTRKRLWAVPVSCQNWIEEGKVISVKKRYLGTCDDYWKIDIDDELERLEDDSRFSVINMEDVDQTILEDIYLAQEKLKKE